MANGVVRVLLEAAGLARVRAALRGVADEGRRADRALRSSAQALRQEQERTSREAVRNAQRAATEAVRADRDAARERSRIDRARIREEERRLRSSLRERSRMMSVSALAGGANAIAGRMGGHASALGVGTRDDLVRGFIATEQRLIRLAGASRSSGRAVSTGDLTARVNEVAARTNVSRDSLVGGLEVAQNRFSRLADFADSLEEIARAAQASGGADQMNDWIAAMGEFQAQLGTTAEDVPELLGLMVDAMDAGSIEAGDVAANFSGLMNTFRNLRGDAGTGIAGATEFLALAEASGGSGMSAEESRTRVQAMMSLMSDPRVRRHIESATGRSDLFDEESGRMNVSWGEMIDAMAANDEMATPEGLRRVLSVNARSPADLRASQGFMNLINLARGARLDPDNAERRHSVSELMQISGARGRERIDTTMDELMNSTSGRALGVAIQAENRFSETGGELVEYMTRSAAQWAALNTEMPMAIEAFGTLREVIGGVVGSMGAWSLAMGGGAGGAVLGGGAAAGAGGVFSAAAGVTAAATVGVTGALFSGASEGSDRSASNARARRDWLAGLSAENRAAFDASVGGFGATDRRRGDFARELMGRDQTTLNPNTIRELAVAMGAEVGRSLASGAPADGRTPGEPGRR